MGYLWVEHWVRSTSLILFPPLISNFLNDFSRDLTHWWIRQRYICRDLGDIINLWKFLWDSQKKKKNLASATLKNRTNCKLKVKAFVLVQGTNVACCLPSADFLFLYSLPYSLDFSGIGLLLLVSHISQASSRFQAITFSVLSAWKPFPWQSHAWLFSLLMSPRDA